ncbi:hypothetical protein ACFL1G_04565 [Planctomycetota bacterium]
MNAVLYIIAGPLFLVSFIGYLYVQVRLRREYNEDLDDVYYEFEDQHPGLAKFNKWSRITLTAAVISALMLFMAMVI